MATPFQHFVSHHNGLAYQTSGEITIGTTNAPVVFLRNDDVDHDMVVSYIRCMSVGAAATNASAYFTVVLGDTYTSGGGTITPVNMHQGSPNTSTSTALDGTSSLVVSGGSEIDRNYVANSMETYNKHGTILLPPGKSVSIWHKGSTVAGTAYARISFYMDHTS